MIENVPSSANLGGDPPEKAVLLAMHGDTEAFTQVIHLHGRSVYTQIFVIVHNHQDAEDISQDTFFKAYKYLDKLDDPKRIRPWLLSIARNLAIDFIRRRRRASFCQLLSAGQLPDPAGPPGAGMEKAEQRSWLDAALAGLPDGHRQALSMRYLEELDHESIEVRMGVSNGRLRGLLGRALEQLRRTVRRDRP